jgi:hypothetical protein
LPDRRLGNCPATILRGPVPAARDTKNRLYPVVYPAGCARVPRFIRRMPANRRENCGDGNGSKNDRHADYLRLFLLGVYIMESVHDSDQSPEAWQRTMDRLREVADGEVTLKPTPAELRIKSPELEAEKLELDHSRAIAQQRSQAQAVLRRLSPSRRAALPRSCDSLFKS